MNTIAYLDIETSGLAPQEDDIIRFVVGLIEDDDSLKIIDRFAKPRQPLSKEVEKLTGITNEQLKDCEYSEKVKKEILELLEGKVIIGSNISFIEKFFGVQFEKKIELSDKSSIENNPLNAIFKFCKTCDFEKITIEEIKSTFNCNEYDAENILYDIKSLVYSIELARKKFKFEDFFNLDKADQVDFLTDLVMEKMSNFAYEDEIIRPRLRKEIVRIQDIDMVADFVVARAIRDILKNIDDEPHFVGVGSSSAIAYILGITEFELDPIENCLIFEIAFSMKRNKNAFNFYITKEKIPQVQQELKKLFGNCEIINKNDSECVLQVSNIKINVFKSKNVLNDGLGCSSELVYRSTVGVFQEDYMRFLHYVGNFSYDEANQIRLDIAKNNIAKIEEHKKEFVKNASVYLPLFESQDLFDKIVLGINYSHSKAWFLSVENISPTSVEFAEELLPF